MRRLWQFIRWYPWRAEAELIRWRDRNWWPWSEADWTKDRWGRWIRNSYPRAMTMTDTLPPEFEKLLSAEINALPDRVRRYIAAIETECDPAGTVRDNFRLREENAGLQAYAQEQAKKLRGFCAVHDADCDTCPCCEAVHQAARAEKAEAKRDFWTKHSAAAWAKCEERRLEAECAKAELAALREMVRKVCGKNNVNCPGAKRVAVLAAPPSGEEGLKTKAP